jgi:hypothetical protein
MGSTYTVLCDFDKVNSIPSVMDAKQVIFGLAYSDYNFTSSSCNDNLFKNETFKELIKQGYKALSKKYHPDITGGSVTKMQKLNELYEVVKAKL